MLHLGEFLVDLFAGGGTYKLIASLPKYFSDEEVKDILQTAVEIMEEDGVPPHKSPILEDYVQILLQEVYARTNWEDWDEPYEIGEAVKLNPNQLYPYDSSNPAQRFLVEEGIIDPGYRNQVITRLYIEKRVPIFEAIDGTKYLAVENLMPDWKKLPNREPGVTPIKGVVLDPATAREVLHQPARLKRILALSV
jgi:hypothetical protein